MKFIQLFLICCIVVKKLQCATITTNSSRLVNEKQQKLIEDSKDLNANPCEDFYQYACGNWENMHSEAGDKYYETISVMDYNVNKEMAVVFSEMNLENEPKYMKRAYQYFRSCDDLVKYDTVNYLNWMMEQENMKFSLLGKSNKMPQEYDWLTTLAVMRTYGLNGIFVTERVVQRGDDPSKFIIFLDKPQMDEDYDALTRTNIEQIIKYLGEPIDTTEVLKLWREIESLELEFKQLDERDYEDESKEESEKVWPITKVKDIELPWLKDYIKILLNETELDPNMDLYIYSMQYFMDLHDLLERYTQHFLSRYLEIRFLYHLDLHGPLNLTTEDCMANVRSFLPTAMNWLYERQHPELKLEFPKITELFENIRTHFKKSIQNNDYEFNETMVDSLLTKINNMQLKFNNIPRINTIQTLENFYDHLDLNEDEFYANHLKILKFKFKADHNLLRNATRQNEFYYVEGWNIESTSVPYFMPANNALVVPLTLLQRPIYQHDFDDVYTYSSIGFLLAHEMFHAFDNNGLLFDHKGALAAQLYEDIFTYPLFNTSFNCFLKHNFSVEGETISDISGLHYAYKIFNDSKTDDTDVSQSKLFFLNFAQFFCGTSYSDEIVETNSHSLDRERIMNALKHIPEFSKVFQCEPSNHMYAQEDCNLWRK